MAKILMMAMSLRKDSFNKKLITNAHRILSDEKKSHCEILQFNDFPLPVYNGDDESQTGIPETAKQLGRMIQQADALILSTPEYNGGMPGAFKNAVDWLSRIKPSPLASRHLLLIGASPGALGAVRGLWHSRVPLEAMGVFVYPEMFGLSQAHKMFSPDGTLTDPAITERLRGLLQNFQSHLQNSAK